MYGENKYYYDNNGNVTKSMTKNGNGADDYSVTETTYNWRNAPVKVLTDGTDSAYYYDAVGNVLRMYTGELTNFTMSGLDNVSGADYEVTKYTYDSQNRLISTTDALNHTSTNTYDINGNLVKTVDRNQNILNSVYDPMGNLIEKSAQESADAEKEDIYTYTYNRMGLPVTMTGNNITTSYTYDNIGRLIQESLTGGIQKEYNYDSNGNRILFKLTKDNAEQINTVYSYDKLDRVQTITNGTNMSTYTYNKNGQLLSDESDDFTTSYSYNAGGMITSLTTSDGTNQIQSHSYQYLPNGNISQKQSTVGTQSTQYNYQYDDAGRLTQEQYGTETKAYTYDPYGNRLQMTLSGTQSGTVGYTYDANNRLLKMTNNAGGTTEEINYTYDNNGNQISWMKNQIADSDGDAALSMETTGEDYGVYGYDMYNRVISYTDGVTTASYTYDANNLRQSKTVDNVTTNHIWDGQNMVMETKGTQVNKYYRGVNGITYASMNGTVSYYHKDAHGDVTALTDSTGTITKNYMYDSFGNQATEDEADTNPFRYAGEYFDAETGQIYLRNRYYDPSTGRFISEDPVMDGLNWYVYCGNNPINFLDPYGLEMIISGSDYDKQRIFNDVKELTRDTLEYTELLDGNWKITYVQVDGTKKDVGTNLIRRIINNEYTCNLEVIQSEDLDEFKMGTEPNNFYTTIDNEDKNTGTGSTIHVDYARTYYTLNYNSDEDRNIKEEVPIYIAIGHELIHSLRLMTGAAKVAGHKGSNTYYNDDGIKKTEIYPREELETTELNFIDTKGDYIVNANEWVTTENALRREHFLNMRVSYRGWTSELR